MDITIRCDVCGRLIVRPQVPHIYESLKVCSVCWQPFEEFCNYVMTHEDALNPKFFNGGNDK